MRSTPHTLYRFLASLVRTRRHLNRFMFHILSWGIVHFMLHDPNLRVHSVLKEALPWPGVHGVSDHVEQLELGAVAEPRTISPKPRNLP